MMALTRVKPVVSHCAVAASTLISVIMEGRAGVTRVWFSTVTNVPKIMTKSIIIWCRANFKSKAPFRGVCRNVFGPKRFGPSAYEARGAVAFNTHVVPKKMPPGGRRDLFIIGAPRNRLACRARLCGKAAPQIHATFTAWWLIREKPRSARACSTMHTAYI